MNISEVIQDLQSALDEYGDLPVKYYDDSVNRTVQSVDVYDKEGNEPLHRTDAAEAFIF